MTKLRMPSKNEQKAAKRLQIKRRLYAIETFRRENLSEIITVVKENYEGKPLTDDEINDTLIILKFVADFCKVDRKFSLMKIDINSEIERLERFKMARKL